MIAQFEQHLATTGEIRLGAFGKACGDLSRALDRAVPGSADWRRATAGLLLARMRGYSSDLGPAIEEFLAAAKGQGDMKTLAHASHVAALWLLRRRRWGDAGVKLKVALALSATCGEELLQGELFALLGAAELLQGELETGRSWFAAAEAFHRSGRRPVHESLSRYRRTASLLMEPGHLVFLEELAAAGPLPEEREPRVWWHLLHAAGDLQDGEHASAVRHWRKACGNGLGLLWDINLCFVLQHVHLRIGSSSAKEGIRKELQRIYGQRHRTAV